MCLSKLALGTDVTTFQKPNYKSISKLNIFNVSIAIREKKKENLIVKR